MKSPPNFYMVLKWIKGPHFELQTKIGTPMILGAHNFVCKPLIKVKYEVNGMWHVTYMQGN
jgi:hypothetical protein